MCAWHRSVAMLARLEEEFVTLSCKVSRDAFTWRALTYGANSAFAQRLCIFLSMTKGALIELVLQGCTVHEKHRIDVLSGRSALRT
jgi:hypothetical protein